MELLDADWFAVPMNPLCDHGKIKKLTTKMICINDPRRNLPQLWAWVGVNRILIGFHPSSD
jgi:hypothetical protein